MRKSNSFFSILINRLLQCKLVYKARGLLEVNKTLIVNFPSQFMRLMFKNENTSNKTIYKMEQCNQRKNLFP